MPGELPLIGDWADHVTTAFPEVRLKSYLEMRGADGGPWRRLCALPALWVGLLYDGTALDAAADLIADWTAQEHEAMRRDVPRLGLDTPLRSRTFRDLALEVLEIAREGLHRRARRDACGEDETHFWTRCSRSPAAAVRPPSNWSRITTHAGAATSAASTRNIRIRGRGPV
jgi:glutamate--cysteine ligase